MAYFGKQVLSSPLMVSPSNFATAFLRSGLNYAALYGMGIFTFVLALFVSRITKTQPDVGTVSVFAVHLSIAFGLSAVVFLVWKMRQMILFEKPASPTLELLRWISGMVRKEGRMIGFLHMLISVSLFIVGFGILKGAIAVLNPFEWDHTFLAMDRILHFGYLPHEFLWPLLNNQYVVFFANFVYNVWFFLLLSGLLAAGLNSKPVHMQYLISFMLTWLIGGFFIATMFSSAGPAFFERAGFGTDYVPLMNALNSASENIAVWALPVQDLLWQGFTGDRPGSAGISAFPSMHVATATLMALHAQRINKWLGWAGWVFVAQIQLGSVLLAWHYAVDGYAGILLALIFWKMAAWLQNQQHLVFKTK